MSISDVTKIAKAIIFSGGFPIKPTEIGAAIKEIKRISAALIG